MRFRYALSEHVRPSTTYKPWNPKKKPSQKVKEFKKYAEWMVEEMVGGGSESVKKEAKKAVAE